MDAGLLLHHHRLDTPLRRLPLHLPHRRPIPPLLLPARRLRLRPHCTPPLPDAVVHAPSPFSSDAAAAVFDVGGDVAPPAAEPSYDAGAGEERVELGGDGGGLWRQVVEIAKFAGPAAGLWICGPLMSLIDTAVIGQGSSVELAALG